MGGRNPIFEQRGEPDLGIPDLDFRHRWQRHDNSDDGSDCIHGREEVQRRFPVGVQASKLFLFIGSVVTLVLMFIFLDHLCQPTGFLANRMGSSVDSTSVKACRPLVKGLGMWGSIKALSRGYNYLMVVVIFAPVAVLAWFPFVNDFQTRLLFNQAFSRGLQIQRIEATSAMLKERIL